MIYASLLNSFFWLPASHSAGVFKPLLFNFFLPSSFFLPCQLSILTIHLGMFEHHMLLLLACFYCCYHCYPYCLVCCLWGYYLHIDFTSILYFVLTRLSFTHHLISTCFTLTFIPSFTFLLIFISLNSHHSGEHSLTLHFVCPCYLPIRARLLCNRYFTTLSSIYLPVPKSYLSFFLFLPVPHPYLLPSWFFYLSHFRIQSQGNWISVVVHVCPFFCRASFYFYCKDFILTDFRHLSSAVYDTVILDTSTFDSWFSSLSGIFFCSLSSCALGLQDTDHTGTPSSTYLSPQTCHILYPFPFLSPLSD